MKSKKHSFNGHYKPDIYEASADERFRYLLGQKGKKVLIAFGINPSTANRIKSDATVTRVMRTSFKNKFDGWLMLNVCSQRATDPKKLSLRSSENEHRKNKKALDFILKTFPDYACLGAWGNLIESRSYLKQCLRDLLHQTDLTKRQWFCYGVTQEGHPKHPSRAAYDQFQSFDIDAYLCTKSN